MRLEHSPHQSPDGDSFPPGGSLIPLRVFIYSKSRLRRPSPLFTLNSSLSTLNSAA
ncbi:MAG: hypothetical protein ACI4RP_02550 [Acutalibacteraceae bacterium]